MAMDGDAMGAAIQAAIEGVSGATLPTMSQDIWKAIGGAIVLHIQTSGVVSTIVATPDTLTGTGVGTIA